MPNAYSLDLRKQILKDYDNGVPIEDLTLSTTKWVALDSTHFSSNAVKPAASLPNNTNEAGKVNWHLMNKKFVRSLPNIPTQRSLISVRCHRIMFPLFRQQWITTYICWKSHEKNTLIATEQKRVNVVKQRKEWKQFQSDWKCLF